MKTFVIGDIHWGYKSLIQCLERSNFNYDKDELISLWDIVDWLPESYEVIEELMKIKNLVFVAGNHDEWLREWLMFGVAQDIWREQWGDATIKSYIAHWGRNNDKHLKFLNWGLKYCQHKKRLFVHGGVDLSRDIDDQKRYELQWDRDLYYNRDKKFNIKPFKEIYIGHTTTWKESEIPFEKNKVWFMDQWGGDNGKLTIMNVDTKEYWQSDKVSNLYKKYE